MSTHHDFKEVRSDRGIHDWQLSATSDEAGGPSYAELEAATLFTNPSLIIRSIPLDGFPFFFARNPFMFSSSSSLPLPNPRGRANSTSLRPNLTIKTCGRRRSNSLGSSSTVQQSLREANIAFVASSESSLRPNMFAIIASRCLQLLYGSPKHSLQWSTPSSPRSSTDDYLLPISASSQKTTFGDVFGEKEATTPHAHTAWWQGHSSVCISKQSPDKLSSSHPLICRYMHLYSL